MISGSGEGSLRKKKKKEAIDKEIVKNGKGLNVMQKFTF